MLKKLSLDNKLDSSILGIFTCDTAAIAQLLLYHGIEFEPMFWDSALLCYDREHAFTS